MIIITYTCFIVTYKIITKLGTYLKLIPFNLTRRFYIINFYIYYVCTCIYAFYI